MKNLIQQTSILLCIFCSSTSLSQNETSKWYFGNLAGLDFLTTPPSILSNSSMTMAGAHSTSSMADAAGSLLFYTDGQTVWNKNHVVMANGGGLITTLTGGNQPCISIKKPASTNEYYIFHCVNGSGPIYYSMIDMSLAAGDGSVTVKNVSLTAAASMHKLTGTKHCNGIDYWIVNHDVFSNTFNAHLVTAAGIAPLPVVTSVGAVNGIAFGSMKISPNGRLLANSTYTGSSSVQLFDFDNSSGIVSNPMSLVTNGITQGIEFSPDGSKLYASFSGKIHQWDLCAGTPTQISASHYTTTAHFNVGYLQMAMNGKIYAGRSGQVDLGVINSPNLPGASCNYIDVGQSLSPNTSLLGLPNFITSSLAQKINSPPFTYTPSGLCQTASFSPPPNPSAYCSSATYSISSLLWNFGDPSSGASNTSTILNPTHFFSSPGTYTTQLVVFFTCGGGIDTLYQTVNITSSCFTVVSNSITCASLGSATVFSMPGQGPFSYTWLPVSQTSSVATGLIPGTYTLQIQNQINNAVFTTTTAFTSLVPLSASIYATDTLNCFGVNSGTGTVLALAGGSGTQAISWTSSAQSFTTSFVSGLSAGIWSVNITDSLTACQVNSVLTIAQPPPLTLTISANPPSVCLGGGIQLNGLATGGTGVYSYSWSSSVLSNTFLVNESIAGNFIYSLTASDSNSCSATATISADFIPNPTLTVSDVSICPLATGSLTVSGASTYTWLAPPTSTPLSVTGPVFTDAPPVSSEYTVIGSALGCTAAATASIILHAVPVPTISSNSPRCENTNLLLNVYGGAGYSWSGPQGFVSAASLNTLSPLSLFQAGVYDVTVTSVEGCTAAINTTVVVNPIPTVAATGATVCTSQTLNLNAISVPGASFYWTGQLGFQSNQQNPAIATPSLGHSGLYYLRATSVEGCTNMATASVSVISPPSLTIALSSPSLCWQAFNGSPNTITLTSLGADTYTLLTPNILGQSGINGTATSVSSLPPPGSDLAFGTATLIGSNGVCASQSTFVFSVVPNPTVSVNSYTPVICAGENFTYTSFGAQSYVWSATTPNFTTYSNGGMAVAHPSLNSVFSVYGSSLGCNSALVTSTITVYPLPQFTVGPSNATVCLYESTILNTDGTGTSYEWLPPIGLNNSVGSTVIAAPITNQQYTVIGSANSCTSSAVITVSVLPLPNPKITAPKELCINHTLNLNGEGGIAYEWRGPHGIYFHGQNIAYKIPGTHFTGNYTLTVTDQHSCRNSTSTFVNVLPLPSGVLNRLKESGCAPFCNTYSFESAKGITTNWSINQQKYFGNEFSHCFSQPGTYTITGKLVDHNTCVNEVQYFVKVHAKPEADFIYTPVEPIENLDEVLFTNTSTGENQIKWTWVFEQPGTRNTKHETRNCNMIYSNPGSYRVVMIVSNTFSCTDTVIKSLEVKPDFSIYVPNVFTPNGDDLNDIFLPIIRSSKLYELKIYNRWGHELFHSKDPQTGWDGTYKGEFCKQDVYVWRIRLSTVHGEAREMTGNVTLLLTE